MDQLKAELRALDSQRNDLSTRLRKLETEYIDLTVPYKVGDIVQDEVGVNYRVTSVGYHTGASPLKLAGIRLAKTGQEAHQNPRPIYSAKLKKVN
jgi:hypothetical protein